MKRKSFFCLVASFLILLALPARADDWQVDAAFPDWISNANFSANNTLAFQFYEGQGTATVTVSEDCKSFSFYINGKKVNTKKMKSGGTYTADISRCTKNGRNILQISGIEPAGLENAVRVQIPYPIVKNSVQKKSPVSKDALSLIEKIISADIAHGFTSAELAVIKDGALVYQNAWGKIQTNDEHGSVSAPAVTNETLYDLASVTKMFGGAYAIQRLVSDGRLSVDAKITDILGDAFADDTIAVQFEGKENFPLEKIKEWKRNLTVRDVLTHTAGFSAGYPYYNDNYDLEKNEFNSGEGKNPLFSGNDGSAETRANTLRQIFRTPLEYEPGTKLVYSDIDFMILCFVAEKVAGCRLDDFLRETFWKPLGLTHITYNPLENGFSKTDCAATDPAGNSFMGNLSFTGCRTQTVQGEVHDALAYYSMAGVSGHAGLFANAGDLARLASLMLTGGYGNKKFFSQNVLDLFVSPQSVQNADYGLGWWRSGEAQNVRNFGTLSSSRAFGHNGFTGTLVFVELEENLVIVINTPMSAPETLNNHFSGNYYQSAALGFVPQIILMGLRGNVSHSQWKEFARTMADDARRTAEKGALDNKNDVRWKAYESLLEISQNF